jgi:hypothetical protein
VSVRFPVPGVTLLLLSRAGWCGTALVAVMVMVMAVVECEVMPSRRATGQFSPRRPEPHVPPWQLLPLTVGRRPARQRRKDIYPATGRDIPPCLISPQRLISSRLPTSRRLPSVLDRTVEKSSSNPPAYFFD